MKRREGKGFNKMKNIKEELKQYLFVIRQLSSREIKRRYTRTSLGIIWSVLNPLLTMLVMAVVFTQMFRWQIEHYALYLMAGQIVWQLFSNATNSAMTSLVDNKALLIRVKYPKMIFPMSRVFSASTNFLYTFIAFIVLMIVFLIPFSFTILLMPVIFICIVLFSLGIGYILSCLYGFFGDIKYLFSVFLTMLMYLSALFYSVGYLGGIVRSVVENNPIYNYISCFRKVMIYGQLPNQAEVIRMIVWTAAAYTIGVLIFKKTENKLMIHLW